MQWSNDTSQMIVMNYLTMKLHVRVHSIILRLIYTYRQRPRSVSGTFDFSNGMCNGVFTLPETETSTETEKIGTVPNGIRLGLGLCPVWTSSYNIMQAIFIGLGLGLGQCKHTIRTNIWLYWTHFKWYKNGGVDGTCKWGFKLPA